MIIMNKRPSLNIMNKKIATALFRRRIIILCVLLFNAVANSTLYTIPSTQLHAQAFHGIASYYAKRATGSITANGERLHHDSMTCAHRTLPFGTLLKVTNLVNNRSVIVRVNDRGPYIRRRIIDLSWGAARELGMLHRGIVKVQCESAYNITIPLRAEPMKIALPKFEELNIELPNTLKPIWQEQDLIVPLKKVKTQAKKRK